MANAHGDIPPRAHDGPRAILVTGASRGIGRATALALAAQGHNLILTARSVDGGLQYQGTSIHDDLIGEIFSGSVNEVAEQCRSHGVRVETVAMNLTDESSVQAAAEHALTKFGSVDTIVSNAIYQGPGINDRFDDLPIDTLRRVIEADAVAPLVLLKTLLPSMLASGRGVYVHVTSGTATLVPRYPAGQGGWGLAYAMAKGSAHRIAGILQVEYQQHGFRAHNLNPGHVTTDAMIARSQKTGQAATGQSPEIAAHAIAWLIAGSDAAIALGGQESIARDIARDAM